LSNSTSTLAMFILQLTFLIFCVSATTHYYVERDVGPAEDVLMEITANLTEIDGFLRAFSAKNLTAAQVSGLRRSPFLRVLRLVHRKSISCSGT
jgi:hypothetical protein